MHNCLYIFDVSPFIHAGSVNKYAFLETLVDLGVRCTMQRTPCGGISLIMNAMATIENSGDMVFCCDRNPVIKKDMVPGYKSNRTHERAVELEKQVAEYILSKCGATVLARDGYEADDIIYTLVRRLHDDYTNIYIYTGDSDLYFLVDDKVSIRAHSSRGKDIDLGNYSTAIKKGTVTPYNSKTMEKIIFGDSSDCIPGIPEYRRADLWKYFTNPVLCPHLGNKDIIKGHLQMIAPEFLKQVDNVFPLIVEDLPTKFNDINYKLLHDLGRALNNKYYRSIGDPNFDATPFVEEMQSLGLHE